MKRIFFCLVSALTIVACGNNNNKTSESGPTADQQALIDEGWEMHTPNNGEFSVKYGVKPVKGIFDNFFDIEMGEGGNMAIKVVDAETNATIRYVYVSENSKTTITEIPAGSYYLKLAFGYDWMDYDMGNIIRGKFTKNAYYQMSDEVFSFGAINTMNPMSIRLKIHTDNDPNYTSFSTSMISEDQFIGTDL